MSSVGNDRWLYVGAFVPVANARHAGGRVAFENLADLRHRHAEVDAVVCTTESELAASAPADVRVFRQHRGNFLSYLLRESFSLGLRRLVTAAVMHTRLQHACQREIERLMKEHSYTGIFVDFTQSALLAQRCVSATGCTAPMTLCVHDIFAQRMVRTRRSFEYWVTGAVLHDEQAVLSSVDRVLTLSEKDQRLAASLYALERVDVKPFRPPEWCAWVRRSAQSVEPSTLLFFANFERAENSDAARWFMREAMPEIHRSQSEVTLTLAGNGSDVLAAEFNGRVVVGTGFIEDPSPLFSRCALAIAPLSEGAGVKFKVLEALAAGVPVIGTPVALEGVDPRPGVTFASQAVFAGSVLSCLAECRRSHELQTL